MAKYGRVIKNPRRSPASFDSAKKRWNVKPTRAQGTAVMTTSTKKAKMRRQKLATTRVGDSLTGRPSCSESDAGVSGDIRQLRESHDNRKFYAARTHSSIDYMECHETPCRM